MKKTNIGIVIAIIILVVLWWAVFSNKNSLFPKNQEIGVLRIETEGRVDLIIDDGDGDPLTFNSKFKEGMTAFSLLKEKTEELGCSFETKTYDIGIFIESIASKKNGDNGKYWLYYVNGEMPQVSSDKKELKAGDGVEFRFEKSPF